MKVGFVAQPFGPVLPPVNGGSIPIWTDRVCRHAEARWDVLHLSEGREAATVTEGHITYRVLQVEQANEVANRLYRGVRKLAPVAHPRRPDFSARYGDALYAAAAGLAARRAACDIVHIHNFSQFVPVIRALNPTAKIVLHMHCEWLTQLDRTMVGKRLAAVDLVVGCSPHVTSQIAQAFPELSSKTVTINNGVDPSVFKPQEAEGDRGARRPTLLYVGRVSPEKGVHVLIDAMREVVQAVPEAHLRIVGWVAAAPYAYMVGISDDPHVQALGRFYVEENHGVDAYGAHLRTQIEDHGLGHAISLEGGKRHENIVACYQQADVLINPSLSESFGMSLIEAMAMEVPVIGARVGGMQYVVDEGTTGLLTPPDDAGALAEAIVTLLKDEDRRRAMGKAGRERVLQHYVWDGIARALHAEYTKLLNHV